MSNTICIDTERAPIDNEEDIRIIVGDRTRPEFVAATEAVSEFLRNLPLTADQNDTLIALMCRNLEEAERGAFYNGFDLGMRAGIDAERNGSIFERRNRHGYRN